MIPPTMTIFEAIIAYLFIGSVVWAIIRDLIGSFIFFFTGGETPVKVTENVIKVNKFEAVKNELIASGDSPEERKRTNQKIAEFNEWTGGKKLAAVILQ